MINTAKEVHTVPGTVCPFAGGSETNDPSTQKHPSNEHDD